ncbi:MAG TPA: hypothetical protein VFL82_08820 [Thermomicrobiales bacterium]|nr:hypothetical protein [Thermomicrobiales bacterium]
MDGHRFDEFTKGIATGASRRRVIKGLAGGVVAAVAALKGRAGVDAQPVTQAYCGNMTCAADPSVCRDGCACCVFGNGNSRCMPPNDCQRLRGNVACAPVDCVVSDWSDWSACSAECGGTRTRTRTVVTEASCDGAACPPLSEEESCGTCPDNAACLDGACFIKYPYCSSYGVAANGGGVSACICGSGSDEVCTTTGDCPTDQVCILIFQGGSFVGRCRAGCPA